MNNVNGNTENQSRLQSIDKSMYNKNKIERKKYKCIFKA